MDARRVVAGLLLGAGLLVGCSGGDDAPSTVPSVTEPATATASPTAMSAPTTPGVIAEQQAVEIAQQYFEVATLIAQEGGGFERLEAISAPDCQACVDQVDRLRQVLDGGRRVEGGDLVVEETLVDQVAGNTALIRVVSRAEPGRVLDASGAEVDTLPADPLSDSVLTIVAGADGSVQVADVTYLGPRPS